ncbi:hypothetical protein [Methylocystis sp. JR02]|uniref:hypothetical protein n=1 Tax=Methylocystis sp. JR02 TaxID=3046284 RepID=UPI0024BB4222|nr:hypothetical protein [Methylocystis sp. JR02]MDJ0450528.1 hypothetical protein [Methylocystis sp. JR02]
MKNAALKFSRVIVALFVGGCATSGNPTVKFSQDVLKNPNTGQVVVCGGRINASAPAISRRAFEATHQACVRNAKAVGYTHELQVTRWP